MAKSKEALATEVMNFDSINKFKVVIQDYIQIKKTPSAQEVFKELLRGYSFLGGLNLPGSTFLNGVFNGVFNGNRREHIGFAQMLFTRLGNKNFDFLFSVDGHLKPHELKKSDEFFSLLIAFFYYYDALYIEIFNYKALYTQIIQPLYAYREKLASEDTDLFINLLPGKHSSLDMAFPFITCLPMPEPKQLKVIEKLLEITRSDFPSSFILPPQDRDRRKIKAIEVLREMDIPESKCQEIIGELPHYLTTHKNWKIRRQGWLLLEKIKGVSAREKLEKLAPQLQIINSSSSADAFSHLAAMGSVIGNLISEKEQKAIVTRLLEILSAEEVSQDMREWIFCALGEIPIPKCDLSKVVDAILRELERLHFCIEEAFGLLDKITIPDKDLPRVTQRLLDLVRKCEVSAPKAPVYNKLTAALCAIKIPLEMRREVIDCFFEKIATKQKGAIVQGVHRLLSILCIDQDEYLAVIVDDLLDLLKSPDSKSPTLWEACTVLEGIVSRETSAKILASIPKRLSMTDGFLVYPLLASLPLYLSVEVKDALINALLLRLSKNDSSAVSFVFSSLKKLFQENNKVEESIALRARLDFALRSCDIHCKTMATPYLYQLDNLCASKPFLYQHLPEELVAKVSDTFMKL